jgi:hypothetical protein
MAGKKKGTKKKGACAEVKPESISTVENAPVETTSDNAFIEEDDRPSTSYGFSLLANFACANSAFVAPT